MQPPAMLSVCADQWDVEGKRCSWDDDDSVFTIKVPPFISGGCGFLPPSTSVPLLGDHSFWISIHVLRE